MSKKSSGVLMYRFREGTLEVLLVHPGGPYWGKKDNGAWSIPKGEFEEEDPLETVKREFFEETGFNIKGNMIPLIPIKQPSGKLVYAWAVEGNCDANAIKSNTFTMEWPPRSGKKAEFQEIDRAGWFTLSIAIEKILIGQRGFIDQLKKILGVDSVTAASEDVNSEKNKTKDGSPVQKSLFE